MKRYNIFLRGRLTRGKFIVYSLPYRSSLCAIQSFAVDCIAMAKKKAFITEKGNIAIGASRPLGLKTCYESFTGNISVKADGSLLKETSTGDTNVDLCVGTAPVDTTSEKFMSCSLSVSAASSVHHTACEKMVTAMFSVNTSCEVNHSEKSGSMSAESNIAIGNMCNSTSVFESVDISPKNAGQIGISLHGNMVSGRAARLYDWDSHKMFELDNHSIGKLNFIEYAE